VVAPEKEDAHQRLVIAGTGALRERSNLAEPAHQTSGAQSSERPAGNVEEFSSRRDQHVSAPRCRRTTKSPDIRRSSLASDCRWLRSLPLWSGSESSRAFARQRMCYSRLKRALME